MKINLAVIAAIVVVAVLVIVFWQGGSLMPSSQPQAVIGNDKMKIEVAVTAEQKRIGLAGRESLSDGQGMLFQYGEDVVQGFWMKGMNFPIDIIWVKDGIIVGVQENAPVPDPSVAMPPIYYPPQPINAVLEVPAGFAAERGWKPGDRVDFKNL